VVTSQRKKDVFLIGVKLVDVAARAGFVLTATYGLAIAQAGQFGLIATLVGLFAFAFNFERHIDIQRRSAGQPHPVFDRHVTEALKFFAFNWAIMVPLFVLAVGLWTHVGWPILLLAVVVVVAEHLSNQTYFYALINARYYPMLVIVAAKNCLLVAVVLYHALFARDGFDVAFVMEVWAVGAALCALGLGVLFWRLREPAPRAEPFAFGRDILGQHRASMTHFLIGLLAILILQFDRLAVGGLLSLEQTGLYFRHTLLVAFAYQAFNIASFNRITPTIFAAARVETVGQLQRRVVREYRKVLIGVPLLLVMAWAADQLTGGVWSAKFHLDIRLMGLLLLGFMLRAAADFPALIMNGRHEENYVLRRQLIAFVIGGALLFALTWRFGAWGAALASVAASGLYAILNWQVLGRLPQAPASTIAEPSPPAESGAPL